MSSLVTRKKSELAAKVQRLQERHDSLAAALDSSGADGMHGGAAGGAVTEAEWKAKYESVKAQLPSYKAMKKELAELEAEVRCVWGGGCESVKVQLPASTAVKKEFAELEAEAHCTKLEVEASATQSGDALSCMSDLANSMPFHVGGSSHLTNCIGSWWLQVYVLQQTEEILRQHEPTGTAPRSDAAAATEVGSAPGVAQDCKLACTAVVMPHQ